ncbi:MAG: 5-bromo-4-chloroindolyl phosphate hydrolysis family protein [Oscillospiraceae bacterium]|nr:5-bromo-4-chloroindolyl phosphate hydrolysis family protein [Oscillospiraceae bacterium]
MFKRNEMIFLASNNSNWDDLGNDIRDVIDKAIYSQDYSELNQSVRNLVGNVINMGSDALKRMTGGSSNAYYDDSDTGSYQNGTNSTPKVVPSSRNMPALYGNPSKIRSGGIMKLIGGIVLTGGGFCLSVLIDLVGWMFWLDFGLFTVLPTIIGVAVGLPLSISGGRQLGFANRFKIYRQTLGSKTYCAIEKLAQNVGMSAKKVRKELQRMIDDGLFLEGHIDDKQTVLITSDATYEDYQKSLIKQAEEKVKDLAKERQSEKEAKDAKVQEVLDRGNKFIAQIRACNDAIPGEEISGKISRMELIVKRIFERAETNPEVVPDLKKLMDYYLPMTVKLLNAYADMDKQPVQGENIQASKREIEETLDTLNQAFEKLLDELFSDTAMDVSSDISVLNTLLAQEGLKGSDFK